jgi:hypothetical protein
MRIEGLELIILGILGCLPTSSLAKGKGRVKEGSTYLLRIMT